MPDFRIPHNLSPNGAAGMIVNERLYLSGLLEDFDKAVQQRDVGAASPILRKVYLSQENIDAILESEIKNK